MSLALASTESNSGELTEVRRIAQFFRIMRIVRIFKVSHVMAFMPLPCEELFSKLGRPNATHSIVE